MCQNYCDLFHLVCPLQECFWIIKRQKQYEVVETEVDCLLPRKMEWLVFWLSPTEPCNLNFTDPEADVEILQRPDSAEECNYLITVYLGFGIEIQVSTKGFLMALLITTLKHTLAWFVENNTPVFITPANLADRQGSNCITSRDRAALGFVWGYNPVKCISFDF